MCETLVWKERLNDRGTELAEKPVQLPLFLRNSTISVLRTKPRPPHKEVGV